MVMIPVYAPFCCGVVYVGLFIRYVFGLLWYSTVSQLISPSNISLVPLTTQHPFNQNLQITYGYDPRSRAVVLKYCTCWFVCSLCFWFVVVQYSQSSDQSIKYFTCTTHNSTPMQPKLTKHIWFRSSFKVCSFVMYTI